MDNCNFQTISHKLSQIFTSHSTSRNSNIQQITQIKSDSEKQIHDAILHRNEAHEIFNDNKTTLSELQKKIDSRKGILNAEEQSRKTKQTTNKQTSVLLRKKIEDLEKQINELTAINSDIDKKNSEIAHTIVISKVDSDEHAHHLANINDQLLELKSTENSREEARMSNKIIQQGALAGCMATLQTIDRDITADENLQGILSPFTVRSDLVHHQIQSPYTRLAQLPSNISKVGNGASVFPGDDESSELNELSLKIQALNRHLALCKRTA